MSKIDSEFECIYKEFYPRVYGFLFKLCRNEYVCEELTQETFYQAFKSFYRFDGSCELFTWLAAVAKRVFFKYLRKSKNQTFDIDLYISELKASPEDEPGYEIHKRVQTDDVRKAILKLQPKYYDVLVLRIYGELPYSEIAKKLGISENSAKVIFFRAKTFLKEELLNDRV